MKPLIVRHTSDGVKYEWVNQHVKRVGVNLGNKQEKFMRMVPVLILFIHFLGYQIRGEDLKRASTCNHGHRRSLHRCKLAIDLTLTKNGVLVIDGTGHDKAHDLWDLMGGSERIDGDLNHYSLAHDGMR